MAIFENAIDTVLHHEGGLADNPADPGGITNFGISINWAKNIFPLQAAFGVVLPFPIPNTPGLIRDLTVSMAIEIYRLCWWDFFDLGRIDDQILATKVMDMAVNMGPPNRKSAGQGQAFLNLQRALIALGKNALDNGLFTPFDVSLTNQCDPIELLKEVCRQQAKFYRDIVAANPTKTVFLKNWLRRSAWPFKEIP